MKHFVLRSFSALATLLVVACIAPAILGPVFGQTALPPETQTLSNAKQIALSGLIYVSDYDAVFPYVTSTAQFRRVTKPYRRDESVWKDANPDGGQFQFAMNLAGVNEADIGEPAMAPMVYDPIPWPDGRRIASFADGHAKKVTQQAWADIKPYLAKRYPRTAKKPIKG